MWSFPKLQLKLGWTEAAMVAGSRDVSVSPSIVGAFPRKEAALVEVQLILLFNNFLSREINQGCFPIMSNL